MVFDPSNSGDPEVDSVNERLPKPPCCLPEFRHAATGMSRYGCEWGADDVDAFLFHVLEPDPTTLLCLASWRTQEDPGIADGLGVGSTFFPPSHT
eukprot:SAG11_NODE_124_length_15798_cov_14.675776_5_plen_95_part_00